MNEPGKDRTEERPTWAVVIPAFNESTRIPDALRSLTKQTEPADVIVVCDDGSHDDLELALKPFRDQILLVRQPNRGLSAARNTGAWQVRDVDWITFLDADDWVSPNFIESLRDAVVNDPSCDILTTNAIGIDEQSGRELYDHYRDRSPFPESNQRVEILRKNILFTGVSVRRIAWERVGGFDESFRIVEDWECWIRMIFAGSRVGLVEPATLYRRDRANSLSSSWLKMQHGRIRVLERALTRSDLTAQERSVARRMLRVHLASLRRAESRRLMGTWSQGESRRRTRPYSDDPDAITQPRAAAWALSRARGTPMKVRVLAAMGSLSPRLALMLWRRRH